MKVAKEKCKVRVYCNDGSFVIGFVHVSEGLRVIDFLNDLKENFIVVTDAGFQNLKEIRSFQLVAELKTKKATIFLHKESIKWVEEI